jgi:hypothetical protein
MNLGTLEHTVPQRGRKASKRALTTQSPRLDVKPELVRNSVVEASHSSVSLNMTQIRLLLSLIALKHKKQ